MSEYVLILFIAVLVELQSVIFSIIICIAKLGDKHSGFN